MSRLARTPSLVLALASTLGVPALADERTITFAHDGPALRETPVVAALADPMAVGPYLVRIEGDDSAEGRAEVWERDGKSWIAAVLPKVSPGRNRYELVGPVRLESPILSFRSTAQDKDLEVRYGDATLTTYRVDSGPKPILYPLVGPGALPYTRGFPMAKIPGEPADHPHQRSLWMTYGAVNGVDFWTEGQGHGTIRETSRREDGAGRARLILSTTDDWLGPDGKKHLEDERTITFWATGAVRVIDFDFTLKATAGPVELGDTKEGMFGVRVASSMDAKNKTGGRILNAEGLTDLAAWGKRSPWVDYSGPIGEKTVGITILDHPESFNHPTAWHVRDYGLFAANPLGKHDFGLAKGPTPTKLAEGDSIKFRYRVVLHEGDAHRADPKAMFAAFAKPPTIVP